jgi:hypothetical protein
MYILFLCARPYYYICNLMGGPVTESNLTALESLLKERQTCYS